MISIITNHYLLASTSDSHSFPDRSKLQYLDGAGASVYQSKFRNKFLFLSLSFDQSLIFFSYTSTFSPWTAWPVHLADADSRAVPDFRSVNNYIPRY
jgi:hypothetical protein